MKVVKNNSDEDAEKKLVKEIKGGDHLFLYFPENNEEGNVILFREMAALPDIESSGTGSYTQEPEHAETSSSHANNESHIISFLKGGLS